MDGIRTVVIADVGQCSLYQFARKPVLLPAYRKRLLPNKS